MGDPTDLLWFGRTHFAENEVVEVAGREYLITEKIGTGKAGHRLWPCAVALSHAITKRKWDKTWSVAELGCGVGLPGMVAAGLGSVVTFFDKDRDTRDWLRITLFANAILARVEPLDWKEPHSVGWSFDVLLGSELIYRDYEIPELARFISKSWSGRGPCLIANAPLDGQEWIEPLRENGLRAAAKRTSITTPDGRFFEFDIWDVRRK